MPVTPFHKTRGPVTRVLPAGLPCMYSSVGDSDVMPPDLMAVAIGPGEMAIVGWTIQAAGATLEIDPELTTISGGIPSSNLPTFSTPTNGVSAGGGHITSFAGGVYQIHLAVNTGSARRGHLWAIVGQNCEREDGSGG